MKIVVIGGTGLIGSKLVTKLGEHGHEAVAAAPNTGVNTLTGEGLAEVLKGASVVIDVSNSPSFEDTAVMEFFETSTRNVLAAEAAAASVTTSRCRSWAPSGCRTTATSRRRSPRRR
ncbi:NAD-dependent epimerase/dehydratase family protein [Streptosporangium lutulentum]